MDAPDLFIPAHTRPGRHGPSEPATTLARREKEFRRALIREHQRRVKARLTWEEWIAQGMSLPLVAYLLAVAEAGQPDPEVQERREERWDAQAWAEMRAARRRQHAERIMSLRRRQRGRRAVVA